MTQPNLQSAEPDTLELAARELSALDAFGRIRWSIRHLPGAHVLSSSFGMQSAVMLHLVTRVQADMPVIFVDTGYHFPETYRFVDRLTKQLDLNLHVFRPAITAAWQEARHGKRWNQGVEGLDAYNNDNKLQPMRDALEQLDVGTWFSGVRHDQSAHRLNMTVIEASRGRMKVHPIIDWTDRDVHVYLKANDLPYHPLRERGYASIGDWHTTLTLEEAGSEERSRFLGLKRECGLHDKLYDS